MTRWRDRGRCRIAEEFAKENPLGLIADVHELSGAIRFLAITGAGYINGATIPVDGSRRAV